MIGYYKLSGAGNDFLALVEPDRFPTADEIRAWCRRGVSLGADGVFVLSRSQGRCDGAVDMVHFNADGGRAELCLNGSRCAARLALELGWGRDGAVELHTGAGALLARPAGDGVEIELPAIVGKPERRQLTVASRSFDGWFVRVGVPHWVLPWPSSLAGAPVSELGTVLRSHPDFGSEGANIDFVRFVSEKRLEIRTYERGVEAETLACGTGVVAAVAAGIAIGCLEPAVTALTAGGFEIRVGGEAAAGRLRRASFSGDARILAHGELRDGAASLPPPASWS
jgi:diaminopimelate epimerase